ncbi:cytochrome P450 [soil metagenome]
MSMTLPAAAPRDPLRPPATGWKAWLSTVVAKSIPYVFGVLRVVWPIARFRNYILVTRYDDVREVFLNDPAFRVPWAEKVGVITGGFPFILGMDDTATYRDDVSALRSVVRSDDIARRLVPAVNQLAEQIVTDAGGELEVVDQLVRRVTFEVLGAYFGIPNPPGEDLRVWATRLFEFQFVDSGNDPALRYEVDAIAPRLRAHVQSVMDDRRASGLKVDDVLGRCLAEQAAGNPRFTDDWIRVALMSFVVGGPPQPPMVMPQALEQLLRRPAELAGAQQAALANDDRLLAGYVFEAMRFDPLGPALPRVATRPTVIAKGTRRETAVQQGATVFAGFSSAMMDDRRLLDPQSFNPRRQDHEYIHFGYGLHACFGTQMNLALLPLMLKPLLKRANLRRAAGSRGLLSKRGAFAEQLWVNYD